ncbi:hypothetical protein CWS20_01355 [Cytobacillus horneckiae]|uniref:Uncharacterized protein n=1 Tax=Cytobacillus horneckiae TaxID=549687 RepID=A0A2N0ZMM8_9BACI|nr:hypothetical protein CWS20_01355 [Cytobacillus horneckiae]
MWLNDRTAMIKLVNVQANTKASKTVKAAPPLLWGWADCLRHNKSIAVLIIPLECIYLEYCDFFTIIF